MTRRRILLLGLMLVLALSWSGAQAEEDLHILSWEPIPWDVRVSPNMPDPACYLPDNGGYHDASIDVKVWTFRRCDTTVMAASVKLTDVSQFRTALAGGRYPSTKTRHVSDMTRRAHAVMGINGDYFNYESHNMGIVIRNGKTLRMRPSKGWDTLVVDDNGDFHILPRTTQADWDNYLASGGTALHTFTFGPGLVIDGEPLTDLDTVRLDCGKGKDTQRIAIGQTGPLTYLILATEGPENEGSVGFDLLEMARLCADMGMINAYNLDGGSSATISLNNNKINSLSSGKIRLVGDCIWFATLVPGE